MRPKQEIIKQVIFKGCQFPCSILTVIKSLLVLWLTIFPFFHAYTQLTPSDSLYTLIGVGDIILGSSYPHAKGLPPNDGKKLLSQVSNYLNNADMTLGNLEGVLLNSGGQAKTCRNEKVCYRFRWPTAYAGLLQKAGFDFISLANNHTNDFGKIGLDTTCAALQQYNIGHAGLKGKPYYIYTHRGIRYGVAAFAQYHYTQSLNNKAKAAAIVQALARKVDVVVVYMHGGAEGSANQRVPRETEYQFGYRLGNLHAFAHSMVDAGADVVLGSGPHVLRGIELYKNRLIAYSLGNFCTWGNVNINGLGGIATMLKIQFNRQGEFRMGEIMPVKQISDGIPVIDSKREAISIIQQLTAKDFPETLLAISNEGYIIKTSVPQKDQKMPVQTQLAKPKPIAQKRSKAPKPKTYSIAPQQNSIPDNNHYVIVGSYTNMPEAEQRTQMLRKAGYKASTLPNNKLARVRVAAAGFANMGQAKAFIGIHKKDFPKGMWILSE